MEVFGTFIATGYAKDFDKTGNGIRQNSRRRRRLGDSFNAEDPAGRAGYAVTTAISAADALTKLARGEFELVLTDMKMETDAAGYDVARAAAAKPEAPVVVILTAFPLLAQQWREAGAHAVLTKPTRVADLLETVDRLLTRARKTAESQ